MKFLEFAQTLKNLEDTTKRLEITQILKDLISNLGPEEVDKGVYLSLGLLKALYENPKFNMADKLIIRAISLYSNISTDEILQNYKNEGDLGNVIANIRNKSGSKNLSILQVWEALFEISSFEGSGSQDKKIQHLANLYSKCTPIENKFITRIVLGTTRLGFTETTIIDALNKFIDGNKESKAIIESKYYVRPDIGLISKKIKESGIKGLDELKIETGVPIEPQLAQRANYVEEAIERNSEVIAELKYDGTRVQLHLDKNKKVQSQVQTLFEESKEIFIKTFTRNLEETTHQFPEIIEASKKYINATSVILDGEAVGFNKETQTFLPFQETIQRKRKHGVLEIAKQIPLRYFVFDILYLNNKSLLDTPLEERQKILKDILLENDTIVPSNSIKTSNPVQLKGFFEKAKARNIEGIMAKNPNSSYLAGGRGYSWMKIKRLDNNKTNLADSIDVVILGYYFGKGERSNFGIGTFLVGIYDKKEERFKTISKIGTGLKDNDWEYLKTKADQIKLSKVPSNVEIPSQFIPDVILEPKIVVEVLCDEISISTQHSCGFALRFPRLVSFRTDKSETQTTSPQEIKDIYNLQIKKSQNSQE